MNLISINKHELGVGYISQRPDGYINATQMCKMAGKLFADYRRLENTQEFLKELSSIMGYPIMDLIQSKRGGHKDLMGTWVHPDIAIHLAQWLSPKFAVQVSKIVREWMDGKSQHKTTYHLERYGLNTKNVPTGYFSIFQEVCLHVIEPMERAGYELPKNMVPDISLGNMFNNWFKKQGYDPKKFPEYMHIYPDGRTFPARAYPNEIYATFKDYMHKQWMPNRLADYFMERDKNAGDFIGALGIEYEEQKRLI